MRRMEDVCAELGELTDREFDRRRTAIREEVREHGIPGLFAVTDLMIDGPTRSRRFAAGVLLALGRDAVPVMGRVAALLASPDRLEVGRAVGILGAMGSAAKEYAPRIAEIAARRGVGFGFAIAAHEAYEQITGRRL